MSYTYYGNELYHHGILGQKWGVRRFQNADGTRTAAGKKRRAEHEDLSGLTDQEVQAKLNRVRNELQYHQTKKQLEDEVSGKAEREKKVKAAINTLKTAVLVTGAVITLKKNGKAIVDAALDSIGSGAVPAAAMGNVVTKRMFT